MLPALLNVRNGCYYCPSFNVLARRVWVVTGAIAPRHVMADLLQLLALPFLFYAHQFHCTPGRAISIIGLPTYGVVLFIVG